MERCFSPQVAFGFFSRGRNEELEELVARRREEDVASSSSGEACGTMMGDCGGAESLEGSGVLAQPYVRRTRSGGSLEIFGEMPRCDVNPWVNATWRVTAAERLKMAVGAPWLIPARLGLALLAILIAVVFSNLAVLGWNGRPEDSSSSRRALWRPAFLERALRTFRRRRLRRVRRVGDEDLEAGRLVGDATRSEPTLFPDTVPMPRWRMLVGSPVGAALWLLLRSVGFWRVKVIGADKLASRARVIVCNHVSMIEPVLLLLAVRATPVTSAEFARLPGIGPVGKLYQLLWLDRGSVSSRQAALDAIALRCARPGFPPVLVFPEGTTLNGRALISFKNGAFTPGAPVQPAVARFPYRVSCGLGLDCSWTTAGPQFSELCLRMMLQPWNRIEVEFLPAYAPSSAEIADPSLFASNVRSAMAAALGAPVTDHSWADMWLNMTARDLGEPPHRTLVSLDALRAFLGGTRKYERQRAAKVLERFATADVEKDGSLTIDQFRAALRGQQPASSRTLEPQRLLDGPAVDALFGLLSRDAKTVDFFSFLVGFALLDVDHHDADDALRLVFALLDSSNEGLVNWTRVSDALARWADNRQPASSSGSKHKRHHRSSSHTDAADMVDDDAFVTAVKADSDNYLTCDEFVTFVKAHRHDLTGLPLASSNGDDGHYSPHPASFS